MHGCHLILPYRKTRVHHFPAPLNFQHLSLCNSFPVLLSFYTGNIDTDSAYRKKRFIFLPQEATGKYSAPNNMIPDIFLLNKAIFHQLSSLFDNVADSQGVGDRLNLATCVFVEGLVRVGLTNHVHAEGACVRNSLLPNTKVRGSALRSWSGGVMVPGRGLRTCHFVVAVDFAPPVPSTLAITSAWPSAWCSMVVCATRVML